MTLSKDIFGTFIDPDGPSTPQEVERFTMESEGGLRVQLATYGACLTSVRAPDRNGEAAEVTLNFDQFDRYTKPHPFFGMTVGRFANRIGGAKFTVDGKTYKLFVNDGGNHLHGGKRGFDKYLWKAEVFGNPGDAGVRFERVSPSGEESYPGTLRVAVTYTVTDDNELIIDYEAESDRATPINLTNHTYWNLNGRGEGSILDHELRIAADQYVEVDDAGIPTGRLLAVDGPMDFRKRKAVGQDIAATPRGYDHCYVVGLGGAVESAATSGGGAAPGRGRLAGDLRLVADVLHPATGRHLEVLTTMPGVQFYSSNMLEGVAGSAGRVFHKHDALCLETEYFPDSVNQEGFFAPILRPGTTYSHRTVHRFKTAP